jgi:anti-sigma factor RsiW
MNRCPDNSEWVLWAADEVSPDRRRTLDAHLATCDECRRESAGVARGMTALSSICTAAPGADAMASLRRRLAEAKAKKAAQPKILVFLGQYRWATAAAAVLIVAMGVFIAIPHNQQVLHHPGFMAPVATNVHGNAAVRSDADVQLDLAKLTQAVEMLEAADGLASADLTPTHAAPTNAAPATKTAPEDPYLDEFDQILETLQAEMDT